MYLPFAQAQGRPTLGLKPLSLDSWIEIDDDFVSQLGRKTWLLANRYTDVFVAQPETQSAQAESLHLLAAHLLQTFPQIYQPLVDPLRPGTHTGIYNRETQQTWQFSDFASAPLDLAARLVQEDLCLLLPSQGSSDERPSNDSQNSYVLAAASVCFPLRWTLREKLGQPLGQIHRRVPSYSQRLKRPVDSVFSRLREGYPGLRFNWSLVDSPELHLEDNKGDTTFNAAITERNAGDALWLRVERQTLRRLPASGGILFTIRTYVYPLAQVTRSPTVAAQLARAIGALSPNMQKYKNLLPFKDALLSYLESQACLV